MFSLVLKGETIIFQRNFVEASGLFKRHPDVAACDEYRIVSDVRRDVFLLFMKRVSGGSGAVTNENAGELRALCDEFGFSGLDDEIRAASREAGCVSREDFLVLRDRVAHQDVALERLHRLVLDLARELEGLRGVPEWVTGVEARLRKVEAGDDARRPKIDASRSAGADEVARLKDAEGGLVRVAPRRPEAGETPAEAASWTEEVYCQREGIIAHLERECGGNVHREGVVEVTASSGSGHESVADIGSNSSFYSNDEPNSCFRFVRLRQTGKNQKGNDVLRICSLEVFGTLSRE